MGLELDVKGCVGCRRAEGSREVIPGAGSSMDKGTEVGQTLNLTFPVAGPEEGRRLGPRGWWAAGRLAPAGRVSSLVSFLFVPQ